MVELAAAKEKLSEGCFALVSSMSCGDSVPLSCWLPPTGECAVESASLFQWAVAKE